ncbi:MAG: ATP-binding protein [Opitutaceae bacterium]|nr:ATP-binding protein [Opitutaceae bacterium]
MKGPRRIAVFGAESTGKTRLAEALARRCGAPWVPEYAREFWDRHGAITLADIPAIAREQWRREDEAAAQAGRLLICDTEALTTVLWSDLLYGTCPEEVRRGAEARCRGYALYLLLDTDAPFAPDPQRCFPDPADRERAGRAWRDALERRGLPFVHIRGSWAEREEAAARAVEGIG